MGESNPGDGLSLRREVRRVGIKNFFPAALPIRRNNSLEHATRKPLRCDYPVPESLKQMHDKLRLVASRRSRKVQVNLLSLAPALQVKPQLPLEFLHLLVRIDIPNRHHLERPSQLRLHETLQLVDEAGSDEPRRNPMDWRTRIDEPEEFGAGEGSKSVVEGGFELDLKELWEVEKAESGLIGTDVDVVGPGILQHEVDDRLASDVEDTVERRILVRADWVFRFRIAIKREEGGSPDRRVLRSFDGPGERRQVRHVDVEALEGAVLHRRCEQLLHAVL